MGRVLTYVRGKFFSTWDRGLATLSLAASLVGILIALITLLFGNTLENVPQYIAYRDFLIWIGLILLNVVFVSKYVHREADIQSREALIQNQINLLTNNFELSHNLVHGYRDELFRWYFQPNVQRHKITDTELRIFRHLCGVITDGVRASFSEYFKSRGINLGNDLSVSVKLIITREEVLDRFHLPQEEEQKIRSQEQWIITVYRDHYTHYNVPSREKALKIYAIDDNTAFHNLVKFQDPVFLNNDLQSLGTAYKNENVNWRKYYNAAIVVPIRYRSVDQQYYRCYGALAVDSLNKEKIPDLYNHQNEYILAHAADLLATFFLLLELLEKKPTQVGSVASTP